MLSTIESYLDHMTVYLVGDILVFGLDSVVFVASLVVASLDVILVISREL